MGTAEKRNQQSSASHTVVLGSQDRGHDSGRDRDDAVSMSMKLGYLVATAIFAAIFAIAVAAQIGSKKFRPALYWTTIIATTTVGTTIADFADRSLGIGYGGGTSVLRLLLQTSLAIWRRTLGSVSIHDQLSKSGNVLLGHHHVFADTGDRLGRLDGGRCRARIYG
jgi:uncharacterized membrane-anchored protein